MCISSVVGIIRPPKVQMSRLLRLEINRDQMWLDKNHTAFHGCEVGLAVLLLFIIDHFNISRAMGSFMGLNDSFHCSPP